MSKRRAKQWKAAGETLYEALAAVGLTDQARRLRIAHAWDKAVGSHIAACTEPEGFSRGVLLVRAKSAAWQNELTFLKKDLIDKVNQALGTKTVKDIKVIAGKLSSRDPVSPKRENQLPTPEDLETARRHAEPISDPEVRSAFENLICVVRQRARQSR